jgi:hypothetical protein
MIDVIVGAGIGTFCVPAFFAIDSLKMRSECHPFVAVCFDQFAAAGRVGLCEDLCMGLGGRCKGGSGLSVTDE